MAKSGGTNPIWSTLKGGCCVDAKKGGQHQLYLNAEMSFRSWEEAVAEGVSQLRLEGWDSNALEKDDLIGAITLTELEMALIVQQCRDGEGAAEPQPRWYSIATGGRVCCIITTVTRGTTALA